MNQSTRNSISIAAAFAAAFVIIAGGRELSYLLQNEPDG